MEKRALIVFAKPPRPGMAKTRLGTAIGMEEAARVYETFARHAFGVADQLRSDGVRVYLFHSPEASEQEIRSWVDRDFVFAAQVGTTLGERMHHAFELAFRGGASRAVIIGTDVPDLRRDVVARAFYLLDEVEVVIGPSTDGGYYLLGMKPPLKDLFDGIAWSTEGVLQQTISKAKALGLSYTLLEQLMDIDTLEDYQAYLRRSHLHRT